MLMLSAAMKPIRLSVIIPSVVLLSVAAPALNLGLSKFRPKKLTWTFFEKKFLEKPDGIQKFTTVVRPTAFYRKFEPN